MLLLAAPLSRADGLLVAQCVEFAACWTSVSEPTPWSDDLSGADLAAVEAAANSTTIPFIVEQNSKFHIRLGVTTIVFDTSGGPVTETLGEFSGIGVYTTDPCPTSLPYCETDTIGTFTVPDGATSATISGAFGNSVNGSTAGECLYLGAEGSCSLPPTVPEPTCIVLLGTGLLGLAYKMRRRFRA